MEYKSTDESKIKPILLQEKNGDFTEVLALYYGVSKKYNINYLLFARDFEDLQNGIIRGVRIVNINGKLMKKEIDKKMLLDILERDNASIQAKTNSLGLKSLSDKITFFDDSNAMAEAKAQTKLEIYINSVFDSDNNLLRTEYKITTSAARSLGFSVENNDHNGYYYLSNKELNQLKNDDTIIKNYSGFMMLAKNPPNGKGVKTTDRYRPEKKSHKYNYKIRDIVEVWSHFIIGSNYENKSDYFLLSDIFRKMCKEGLIEDNYLENERRHHSNGNWSFIEIFKNELETIKKKYEVDIRGIKEICKDKSDHYYIEQEYAQGWDAKKGLTRDFILIAGGKEYKKIQRKLLSIADVDKIKQNKDYWIYDINTRYNKLSDWHLTVYTRDDETYCNKIALSQLGIALKYDGYYPITKELIQQLQKINSNLIIDYVEYNKENRPKL